MAGKFCVTITHCRDDGDRCTVAFVIANAALASDKETLVFLSTDGVWAAKKGQAEKIDENLEAIQNLLGNLKEYGRDIDSIPIVFQWNKRDLPTALPLEELEAKLNPSGAPTFEAVAATGEGVFPTLKALASLVLESINRDKKDPVGVSSGASRPAAAAAAPAAARAPAPARAAAAAPAARPARPARPAPAQRPAARAPAPPPPPPPASRPKPQRARAQRAEPARRPVNRPTGKVQIRERTDTGRLLLMLTVAAVIIGAVGFLIMRYL